MERNKGKGNWAKIGDRQRAFTNSDSSRTRLRVVSPCRSGIQHAGDESTTLWMLDRQYSLDLVIISRNKLVELAKDI